MNNFGRFSQAKINLLYSAGASPRPTDKGVMPRKINVERTMSTKNFPRVKVFSQVFFKKLAGFGAEPHKTPNTN